MNIPRAAAAGTIATGVLTALWLIEPSIGLPKIAVGQILSTVMSVSVGNLNVGAAGGWAVHLLVGIGFALIYAAFLYDRLPGHTLTRGAMYGAMIFLLAQIAFMPLVGGGFFSSGDVELLLGSLIGHVAYGVVLGWIYGLPLDASAAATPRSPLTTGAT